MNHDPAHNHSHVPKHQGILIFSLILTGGFMFAEVIGGLISGSLALLSDAGHMLNDALGLGLALWALRFGTRAADSKRTYGNRRAETVMAFTNGITLVIISALIFKEGLTRLFEPVTVHADQMLWIAVLGLFVNIIVAGMLFKGSGENLNVKGAFLHVLGDLLGSVGAIVAALVIQWTGWVYADPLVSLLIAGLILRTSWRFLGDTWHILLEGTPPELDLPELERRIRAVAGVVGVHDLHVWSLTGEQTLLTAHLQISDEASSFHTLTAVRQLLQHEYHIEHSTLEPELIACDTNCSLLNSHSH